MPVLGPPSHFIFLSFTQSRFDNISSSNSNVRCPGFKPSVCIPVCNGEQVCNKCSNEVKTRQGRLLQLCGGLLGLFEWILILAKMSSTTSSHDDDFQVRTYRLWNLLFYRPNSRRSDSYYCKMKYNEEERTPNIDQIKTNLEQALLNTSILKTWKP